MRSAIVLAMLVPAMAHARPDMRFRLDAVPGDPSQLVATVMTLGEPLQPARIQLALADGGVPITATSVRPFSAGPETVAIALVLQRSQWLCGDHGALHGIQEGLRALALDRTTSPGSTGTIVVHDTEARVIVPMGPIGRLTSEALRGQCDDGGAGSTGTRFIEAVELAVDALPARHLEPRMRGLVVVIGDGWDESAATRLALWRLYDDARFRRAEIVPIVYRPPGSTTAHRTAPLGYRTARYVDSPDALATTLRAVVADATDIQYATFSTAMLPSDGRERDVVLTIHGITMETTTVTLGRSPSPSRGWFPYELDWASWRQLAIGLGLLTALALCACWRTNRNLERSPGVMR